MTVNLNDPWKLSVDTYQNGQCSVSVRNKNKAVVCLIKSGAGDKEQIGKIIASAPYMINLLKAAAEYLNHPEVKSIRFVIGSGVVGENIQKLLNDIEG